MDDATKFLRIWINGKPIKDIIEIKFPHYIRSLKRLKDHISLFIRVKNLEKMKIFSHKGLELEDSDIEYIKNHDLVYVSLDGQSFNVINYINEYEYIKEIKSGGYGTVCLAKNLLNEGSYAVKKIDLNNLLQNETYNIYREAIYLESLKHKHIIKFLHSFIHNNVFYHVMEFAKGGELYGYITEKKYLSEKEAKSIFFQIHEAVKYIHSKNVIHRDLKPHNILFSDENRTNIVLIDFGISGLNWGNIKEKTKAGTLRYSPPEVASGSSYLAAAPIDYWAMGIILYFMLFGKHPFEGTENEIINKIISEKVIIPKNNKISKICEKIIFRLLEKNMNDRLDIYDPLYEEWYEDKSCDLIEEIDLLKKENIINSNQIQPKSNDEIKKYDDFKIIKSKRYRIRSNDKRRNTVIEKKVAIPKQQTYNTESKKILKK